MSATISGDRPRRRRSTIKKEEVMGLDGDVGELRGLMQGVKKQQNDFSEWLLRFEDEHKRDLALLRADMARIETKLNEHATRNRVFISIGSVIGAAILSLSTLFSGVWSYLIGKH